MTDEQQRQRKIYLTRTFLLKIKPVLMVMFIAGKKIQLKWHSNIFHDESFNPFCVIGGYIFQITCLFVSNFYKYAELSVRLESTIY